MTCRIRITTVLINKFVEVIDIKDFNAQSVAKSIANTKKQLREGINTADIIVEADAEVLWEY